MTDIKEGWLRWFIHFFDKKTKGCGVTTFANKSAIKSIPQNEQLADELHKPIIRKLKKKEKYIQHLKTIFGLQIKQICNL